MSEQIDLFQIEESYNLANLKQICYEYIKRKFKNPVECEDYADYIQFIHEETELELAQRLRKIADDIEKRIFSR